MERNYFTVAELMSAATERAKRDPRWIEETKKCNLDYDMLSCHSLSEAAPLKTCDFDIVGFANYGGSEGIYGDIYIKGYGLFQHAYTLKTLECSRDAYVSMSVLCGLISYHGNNLCNENLDRFD